MAKLILDIATASLGLEALLIRLSDGYVWDGVDEAFEDPTGWDDTAAEAAPLSVTEVQTTDGSTLFYTLTLPAGVTVPCHVALYSGGYNAGDSADYHGSSEQITVDWTDGGRLDTIVDSILTDTGTDGVVVADKTGFKLASDGLDTVATTAPSGVASNFREMLVQVWRRFFKKSTLTSTELKTYADNGTDVLTTQTVSDDDTTQTQGSSS